MKHLRAVNKYFWKYRMRFFWGLIFIILSNYFRILTPQVTGYVVNSVEKELRDSVASRSASIPQIRVQPSEAGTQGAPIPPQGIATQPQTAGSQALQDKKDTANYDILVKKFIRRLDQAKPSFGAKVAICGITLLILALVGGFFMFLMRQTIIVMSRHIEYDQKKEIYDHYQLLDANFYKTHSTG
ncbi:MAG TPA: hypothetical protein VIM64_13595, partial [Puia sp.]